MRNRRCTADGDIWFTNQDFNEGYIGRVDLPRASPTTLGVGPGPSTTASSTTPVAPVAATPRFTG